MAAKTQAEIVVEFAQAVLRTVPVVILGSGASAAHGVPGMASLAAALKAEPAPSGWNSGEEVEWERFKLLIDKGVDLESALAEVRFSEPQTDHVVRTTRSFLLPHDVGVLDQVLLDRRAMPLSRLYKHLFTSTARTINVITSNYDRLAEYAADAGDFAHFTGFTQGYLQSRALDPNTRLHSKGEALRTVCVWKVHGSLSWFQAPAGDIVGIGGEAHPPAQFRPLMVTPGIDKYRLTHGEPFRTILGRADAAIEGARSYFCVGYGFNDEHLQTKLVERCGRDAIPLVIITKELTASTKEFLRGGRCRSYVAFEEHAGGTKAFTPEEPAGIELPGMAYWRLDEFLNMAIGPNP